MVADGLLHGAFEGLVAGGDRQEEVFGAGFALREEPLVPPLLHPCSARLLLSSPVLFHSCWGGVEGVEEGDGGRREEAGGWQLLSSCGKMKEVLQGDGAPPN